MPDLGVRPPDVVVGGLRFYYDYFFLLLRLCQLVSELTERNSIKTGYMFRSKSDIKMHVQNLGSPLSLKVGGPKTKSHKFSMFFDDFAT